jgi:hypothetical protein
VNNTSIRLALMAAVVLPLAAAAAQDAMTADQRIAALKQSLQESQVRLRKYEWIETTIISLKGEEKARTQKRCYYGADGKIQKLAIGEAPPPKKASGGGRRGGRLKEAIIENKKSDMQEYMERASTLVHQYIPPAPAQIQKVRDAGKLAIRPLDQGRVRVELVDYLLTGDQLAIDVNTAASSLAALTVSTYLDERDDSVVLAVKFGSLNDGTSYTAQTTLDAKAKNIQVVIQNSGHRLFAQ